MFCEMWSIRIRYFYNITKFTVDSIPAVVLYYPRFHGKEGLKKECYKVVMTKIMSRVRLGDVATVRCGLVLSRKQSRTPTDAKYRLLNLRSINVDGCVEMAMVDEYYAIESLSPDYLSQVGDVIVRLTAPYTAILVDDETAGMVVSSNFVIIRPNPRMLLSGYLAWLLNTRKTKRVIFENTSSNMLGAINPRYFACMEVVLPSIDRQFAIADLNALALKEGRLLRRLADEKKRYCDFIINALQTDERKGL